MADVPQVTITAGIPTGGTGTVQTLSTTNAILGEVQASPTANTVLDRLKALLTNLAPAAWTFGSGAIAAGTPRVALATDSPGVSTSRTTAQTMSAGYTLVALPTDNALPAGTNHLGQVQTAIQYVDVTLTIDTAQYGSGDLLADAQIVAACTRANDIPALLQSLVLIDEDDEKAAMTIYFSSSSASWGTENSAPSISDANAREVLGYVDIATADYKDLGGVSVVNKANLGIVCKPVTSNDDIYVAVVNSTGTQTYTTASDLKLRLGFI